MKVLLAENTTIEEVKLPVFISPKIDGVRCFIESKDGKVIASSRTGKPIPNKHVQKLLADPAFLYLDGEITIGEPNSYNVFRHSTAGLMRRIGKPKFIYNVFDYAKNPMDEFCTRYKNLQELVDDLSEEQKQYIRIVPHILADTFTMLYRHESEWLKKGYEGIMVRSLSGKYKNGRSTKKEGILLKIKRFADAEARIIGVEEFYHNENEATINANGYTERSSSKKNMVPAGILGALVVKCIDEDICDMPFSIGSGFNMDDRKKMWDKRDTLIGKLVKFKYFPSGSKEKPRFPIFQGMRSEWDVQLSDTDWEV